MRFKEKIIKIIRVACSSQTEGEGKLSPKFPKIKCERGGKRIEIIRGGSFSRIRPRFFFPKTNLFILGAYLDLKHMQPLQYMSY